MAEIAWGPRAKFEIASAALPESSSRALPSGVGPSNNVIVPSGGPPAAVTVATNVSVCPKTGEVLDAASATVVADREIVNVIGAEVVGGFYAIDQAHAAAGHGSDEA